MRVRAYATPFLPLTLAVAISFSFAQAAFAQDLSAVSSPALALSGVVVPARLTLASAIDLALSRNSDIAAAQRELEASEGALQQGRARPNPELSYLLEDTRQATRTTTVQVNQAIEIGGKRSARVDAAERGREAAANDLNARRAEVRAQVSSAFYELLTAQERIRLAQDTVELAHRAGEAAGKRVAAGKISPVEETKARVAESGARLELAQAQGELRSARQRLGALWGDPSPRFDLADGSAEVLPVVPSLPNLDQRLVNAPGLKRAQIEVQRRRALADLERARRLPDPTLSLGVKRSQELGRNQILLGVSMPIPLFDSNAGNQLQALKQYEKAQDELAATQTRLYADALQARERLSTNRLEVETLRQDLLPGAQAAYDAASKGFELGKFGFLDVLDAQRTLFQARSQYLRAIAETHRAAADIDRLLGQDPSN